MLPEPEPRPFAPLPTRTREVPRRGAKPPTRPALRRSLFHLLVVKRQVADDTTDRPELRELDHPRARQLRPLRRRPRLHFNRAKTRSALHQPVRVQPPLSTRPRRLPRRPLDKPAVLDVPVTPPKGTPEGSAPLAVCRSLKTRPSRRQSQDITRCRVLLRILAKHRHRLIRRLPRATRTTVACLRSDRRRPSVAPNEGPAPEIAPFDVPPC